MNSERLAIVALGSNLGNSVAAVRDAIHQLERLAQSNSFRASSLWRSVPVDCPSGSPDFINAVGVFDPQPGETPQSLLQKLQALEHSFGRMRTGVVNESRTLDLDLIAFGQETLAESSLTLPHPRAHLRSFVLAPLAEIDPSYRAPGWLETAGQLVAKFETNDLPYRIPAE